VRILPLLIGRVRLDFWANAFGGEIKGTVPVGDSKGDVDVVLDKVELSKIEPVAQAIGVPIRGTVTGKVALSPGDGGKFSKANGSVELTIEGASVSDGKTKLAGLIELPQAKLGTITFTGEAKDGLLKVSKLAANGPDLELAGDGKVTLKESPGDSIADLFVRFKFTDAYRGKNATTKSLLGEPGSTTPGIIDMQVPQMKKAKRPDGFFGWHIYGPLKKLKFDPSAADFSGASPAAPGKRGKGADAPFGAGKRPPPGMPLGLSTAKPSDATPPPPDRDSPEIIKPSVPPDLARRAPAMPEIIQPAPPQLPVQPIVPPAQPAAPPPPPPEPNPAPEPPPNPVPDQPAPEVPPQ
jgi:type II secretion system protein N